ncbi:NAD(P)H-dependent oxidoreductase [Vibrio tapetis subsp. quintayensis]|uniref:NAD(P)H-dependent oxidoreductase n=1 Tax=Vibrio tapetis TaxID=52443 RepID=UPI0025B40DBB|nr:NAD(P)H-dependent oxidoreductase [Vibrio tapetis]MDN3682868.1 NAD(P)H-dependent oxidoreductase [Vibrio tapetis subsp. quintayensis]
MNTLVLTAHPELSTSTANRTWFEALSGVDNVVTRDLTAVGGATMLFDPAIEQALIEQADRIVMQFPFYWYSSPPVLKAWIDQVLLYGFAYGQGGDKLHGKELILAITTGGAVESFQSGSFNRFSMNQFLTPFEQTAKMVGMTYLPPFVLHSAMSRDKTKLNASTDKLINYVTKPRIGACNEAL